MGDYEILELARTGMTGLSRGSQSERKWNLVYRAAGSSAAGAVQIYRALRGMKVEKKFQLKENGKKAVDKWDVVMLK